MPTEQQIYNIQKTIDNNNNNNNNNNKVNNKLVNK